jgi:predicted nucleotidyltransferase
MAGPELPVPVHIRGALARYRELLLERFGDRLDNVALFGSRARGTAREDSDIDVFVCIRGASSVEENEAAAISGDVAVETGVWLSPAVYSSERFARLVAMESPFARAVEKDQIRL